MVNDLTAMLQLLESSTLFLTGIGAVLVFVVYQIGMQRSLLTGIVFAGLISFMYGTFMSGLITADFVAWGVFILIVGIGMIAWMLANKDTTKIGGTA